MSTAESAMLVMGGQFVTNNDLPPTVGQSPPADLHEGICCEIVVEHDARQPELRPTVQASPGERSETMSIAGCTAAVIATREAIIRAEHALIDENRSRAHGVRIVDLPEQDRVKR